MPLWDFHFDYHSSYNIRSELPTVASGDETRIAPILSLEIPMSI